MCRAMTGAALVCFIQYNFNIVSVLLYIEIGGVEIVEVAKDHMLLRLTQLSPAQKVPDYVLRVSTDAKTKVQILTFSHNNCDVY